MGTEAKKSRTRRWKMPLIAIPSWDECGPRMLHNGEVVRAVVSYLVVVTWLLRFATNESSGKVLLFLDMITCLISPLPKPRGLGKA
ncbi:Hypothetical protein NTJ_06353 [Nesidiocoris tenuis]|uniref:Uncharacterized protein n=1 Tax=Nesidiocoris tenuis TaxID=355587 RepID=A0ABN7AQ30_9HEMI|nr:Hypothetical protein NTJ_06353 [Nesidiocoris tenuis]